MATYTDKISVIISYDLVNPGRNYPPLLAQIKGYKTWAKITESCYMVRTTDSAEQVRDALMAHLDANDKLFVSVVSPPAAWYGLSDSVSGWLQNNLV